jgi:lysyl-tRNA synthetase, class II
MRPETGTAPRTTPKGLASGLVPTAAMMASPPAAVAGQANDGSEGDGAPPERGGWSHFGTYRPVSYPTPLAAGAAAAAPAAVAAPAAAPASGPPRPRAAKVLAWLTALGGVLNLIALLPVAHDRHGIADHLLDLDGRVVGHVASVVIGLALLVVARQLAHGKRRAWEAALVLFAIGAVVALLKGPHPVLVVYTVAMLVALVWHRDAFPARPDPGSLLDVVRFAVAYLVLVVTFGTVTLLLEQEHVEEPLTVNTQSPPAGGRQEAPL